MKKISLLVLACAGLVIHTNAATNFATHVIRYHPGANFAPGYTNIGAVLGEPSRVNPFGDTIDPFDPPYSTGQVISIGEGGALVVKFARPIFNAPRKPFGLDFIIFGNSGFVITNDFDPMTFDWIGTPATDGSLFANNSGLTRVSVSRDGFHYFLLDTNQASVVDGFFPTDSSGDIGVPVNPALTATNFAGATLDDIRALYAGSGGGTGYNMGWARNRRGRRVHLPHIRYVRVEVLSGKAEIDAFSAVSRTVNHAK